MTGSKKVKSARRKLKQLGKSSRSCSTPRRAGRCSTSRSLLMVRQSRASFKSSRFATLGLDPPFAFLVHVCARARTRTWHVPFSRGIHMAVPSFVQSIYTIAEFSSECLVISLLYIERLCSTTKKVPLSRYTRDAHEMHTRYIRDTHTRHRPKGAPRCPMPDARCLLPVLAEAFPAFAG